MFLLQIDFNSNSAQRNVFKFGEIEILSGIDVRNRILSDRKTSKINRLYRADLNWDWRQVCLAPANFQVHFVIVSFTFRYVFYFSNFVNFVPIFEWASLAIFTKRHRNWRDLVKSFSKIYTFVMNRHLWKKLQGFEVCKIRGKFGSPRGTSRHQRVKFGNFRPPLTLKLKLVCFSKLFLDIAIRREI